MLVSEGHYVIAIPTAIAKLVADVAGHPPGFQGLSFGPHLSNPFFLGYLLITPHALLIVLPGWKSQHALLMRTDSHFHEPQRILLRAWFWNGLNREKRCCYLSPSHLGR